MSDDHLPDGEQLDRWLARVEREWTRSGISRRDQRRLGAEVQRDLEEAIAAGAPAHEVLDPDHVGFARSIAAAHGLSVDPVTVLPARRLALRATTGAIAGFAIGWFFVWPVLNLFLPGVGEAAYVVIAYGAMAVVTVAGAVVGLRTAPGAAPTGREAYVAVVGLVVGALALAPAAVGIGVATDYGSSALVVAAEAAVVAFGGWCGFLLAAGGRSRWIART